MVVGTDRVASNGDVANKIGTYMVAVLAKRHGIPFYVACPLSTIDRGIASGAEVPIEERAADEVTGFRECLWAAQSVKARNPAFDVMSAELVTAPHNGKEDCVPAKQRTYRQAVFRLSLDLRVYELGLARAMFFNCNPIFLRISRFPDDRFGKTALIGSLRPEPP